MRKWIFATLLVVTIIVAPGCWNKRELNTLAITMGIGLDKAKTKEPRIESSLQILNPSAIKAPESSSGGGLSNSKGIWTLVSTGSTVFEAIRNATEQSDRKIYISHNKIIVIGEELARTGVEPIIDFFNRDHESRQLSWFLVAKNEAKSIIEAQHPQEKIPAQAIDNLIKASHATSTAVAVNLYEFTKVLSSKSTDPVASKIELVETSNSSQQTQKVVKLTGSAVFKKDKLIGWLDKTETRGLNWILGKVQSGIVVMKPMQDKTKRVSIEIIKSSSKISPKINGDKISIEVGIETECNLGEQTTNVDLTKPEAIKILEQQLSLAIKNEVDSVLKKAQQAWGVDIFGFGEAVHRNFPSEWKYIQPKWRNEIRRINVDIKVDAKLKRVGLITTPETSTQD